MRTHMPKPALPVLLLALLLGACATGPTFNTAGVDPVLTPQSVADSPQAAIGRSVQWGGTILGVTNLQNRTQIEVLGYPLGSNARPQTDGTATGRFILEQSGFLDPATYAKGRLISAVGTVNGTRPGKVGEASYDFPLVEARQMYLWPESRGYEGSGVTFGVGVGAGSWGGGSGWGVGVGTGF